MRNIKKKAAIYPYYSGFSAIARYLEKLNPIYHVEWLVVPGFRYEGKDAGLLYNEPMMGMTISNNITAAIDECDCLIITDGNYPERFRENILGNILLALKKNKEIICTLELMEDELNSIREECSYNDILFKYPLDIKRKYKTPDFSKKLITPKASVIFIGEVISGLDSFKITLGITTNMRKHGYKTITLVEKSWCDFLNLTPMPDFMIQNNMDDNSKVYAFNQFIRQLEQKENPDLIIIQLPGAIMRFNDNLTAGFGIVPYLIGLAVQAEYMIFSSSYNIMPPTYYESLSERFEHQIGVGIDFLHMSNALIDVNDSKGPDNFSFLRVEQEKVENEVNRLNQIGEIPVFNCNNLIECEEMCEQIISMLAMSNIA